MGAQDKIELLSVSLLNSHRLLVNEFRNSALKLGLGLGWHYLLDLSWAASQLPQSKEMLVIDAGAGYGLMQWWLSDKGIDVLSIDKLNRDNIPNLIKANYNIYKLISNNLNNLERIPIFSIKKWGFSQSLRNIVHYIKGTKLIAFKDNLQKKNKGKVILYNTNLSDLKYIVDNSIDLVISISALEHNQPDQLMNCINELMRTIKPGGCLIATLAASKDHDWFHEPSQGWCYTENSIRKLFNIPNDCASNFQHYDEYMTFLKSCNELKDNLSDFYFNSGNNGMPFGIWDPKYQPVGIVKIKHNTSVC